MSHQESSPRVKRTDSREAESGGCRRKEPKLEEGVTVVHSNIICDKCDRAIVGVRYKCGNCMDFDLCESCEATSELHHSPDHAFIKLKRAAKYPLSTRPLLSNIIISSPSPIQPAANVAAAPRPTSLTLTITQEANGSVVLSSADANGRVKLSGNECGGGKRRRNCGRQRSSASCWLANPWRPRRARRDDRWNTYQRLDMIESFVTLMSYCPHADEQLLSVLSSLHEMCSTLLNACRPDGNANLSDIDFETLNQFEQVALANFGAIDRVLSTNEQQRETKQLMRKANKKMLKLIQRLKALKASSQPPRQEQAVGGAKEALTSDADSSDDGQNATEEDDDYSGYQPLLDEGRNESNVVELDIDFGRTPTVEQHQTAPDEYVVVSKAVDENPTTMTSSVSSSMLPPRSPPCFDLSQADFCTDFDTACSVISDSTDFIAQSPADTNCDAKSDSEEIDLFGSSVDLAERYEPNASYAPNEEAKPVALAAESDADALDSLMAQIRGVDVAQVAGAQAGDAVPNDPHSAPVRPLTGPVLCPHHASHCFDNNPSYQQVRVLLASFGYEGEPEFVHQLIHSAMNANIGLKGDAFYNAVLDMLTSDWAEFVSVISVE